MTMIAAPKYETVEIDGDTYRISTFAATRGGRLFLRVVKVLGPSLSALTKLGGGGVKGLKKIDLSIAIEPLGKALANLDTDESWKLITDMLECVTATLVDERGQEKSVTIIGQAALDRVFQNKLPALFKVAAAAIKVNFEGFLPGSDESPLPETPEVETAPEA